MATPVPTKPDNGDAARLSPLWCANDDPHPAHQERNQWGYTNYCTGRPLLSVGKDET